MQNISRRAVLQAGGSLGLAGLACTDALAAPGASYDGSADVIVVGLGGAGASTAITAADHGARVLILEKQPRETLRSNTRMSGGYIHCPSKDGDKKALKSYFTGLFSGRFSDVPAVGEDEKVSEEMAEAWTQICPQLDTWLQSLDPALKIVMTGGKAQYTNYPGAKECSYHMFRTSYPERITNKAPTYNLPKEQTTGGEALWKCLENGILTRKDKIAVRYSCPAKQLIVDKTGKVTGVVARQGGKTLRFEAKKAVVLCCGGYEYSPAMRRAFLPGLSQEGWAFYGTTANEGEGIEMALEAGAAMDKAAACASRLVWAAPVRHNGLRIGMTTRGIGSSGSIVVNSFGRRYVSENSIMGGVPGNHFHMKANEINLKTLGYDNIPSWFVFDESVLKARCLVSLVQSTNGYGFVDYGAEDNSDAVKKGWILKADTIEALAEKIAATPDNGKRMTAAALRETVDQFNGFCDQKKDAAFGRLPATMKPLRDGPFYAIPLVAGGSNTKGGLAVNGSRQVLNWSRKPIPGLYAVGEIACGLNQGGAMLTDALIFGIVCGNAVAALKG